MCLVMLLVSLCSLPNMSSFFYNNVHNELFEQFAAVFWTFHVQLSRTLFLYVWFLVTFYKGLILSQGQNEAFFNFIVKEGTSPCRSPQAEDNFLDFKNVELKYSAKSTTSKSTSSKYSTNHQHNNYATAVIFM
jgi:hypothetical protein